jgi:hypothetical protein
MSNLRAAAGQSQLGVQVPGLAAEAAVADGQAKKRRLLEGSEKTRATSPPEERVASL